MKYYLISFHNTHTAIAAQKFLKNKLTFQVIPTLREISDSCGISLKLPSASKEEILHCMKDFSEEAAMYQIYLITPDAPPICI